MAYVLWKQLTDRWSAIEIHKKRKKNYNNMNQMVEPDKISFK